VAQQHGIVALHAPVGIGFEYPADADHAQCVELSRAQRP